MASPQLPYVDRYEAGRLLATRLTKFANNPDTIVLGLARGGVVVAYEVACTLNLPLDVLVVRKLGVPGQGELAMGAIASGGLLVRNPTVLAYVDDPDSVLHEMVQREQQELDRREKLYRKGRPLASLEERIVILVDDGLATGTTMRVAVQAIKRLGAEYSVLAVPIGSSEACLQLESEVDELICLVIPSVFYGVGQFYEDFAQTTDREVQDLLARAAGRNRGV